MVDDTEKVIGVIQERGVEYDTNGEAIPWTEVYVKIKVAFRQKALKLLKGPKLSCFLCVALHVGDEGTAHPSIDTIMRETGYSRSIVCNALADLEKLGFIEKQRRKHDSTLYHIRGYVWFGSDSKPTLLGEAQSSKSELSKPQSKGSKRLESESLPNEPKDNPSPKDQPTTVKDNLGSDSEKSDSDFPENPPAPSPGGGADSEKEQEHEQKIGSDHPVGHSERRGDLGVCDGGPVEVDRDAGVDALGLGINGDHRPDPTLLALERRTAAAREKAGGNWTDAGADGLATFGLFCLYDKRNKAPPTQGTKQHRQQCDKVAEALRAYGYQQAAPELVEKAAEIHCQRKGRWVNVFYKSFVPDFGEALQDAEYFMKHGRLPDDGSGKQAHNDPAKYDEATRMTLERLNHGNR